MGLTLTPTPRGSTGVCPRFGKDELAKGAAKKLAKQMQRRGGGNVQAYLCRGCGRWHVGNRRKFT